MRDTQYNLIDYDEFANPKSKAPATEKERESAPRTEAPAKSPPIIARGEQCRAWPSVYDASQTRQSTKTAIHSGSMPRLGDPKSAALAQLHCRAVCSHVKQPSRGLSIHLTRTTSTTSIPSSELGVVIVA